MIPMIISIKKIIIIEKLILILKRKNRIRELLIIFLIIHQIMQITVSINYL